MGGLFFNPICRHSRVIDSLLNSLVCKSEEKIVMANEMARFGGFILFYFVILCKLILKYVIRFARLKNEWK